MGSFLSVLLTHFSSTKNIPPVDPRCFFKLPQELRDEVYIYYFSSLPNKEIPIDLRHPVTLDLALLSPHAAITLISKRLRYETFEPWYRPIAEGFWYEHTFVFVIDPTKELREQARRLRAWLVDVPGILSVAFEVAVDASVGGLVAKRSRRTRGERHWRQDVVGLLEGVRADCGAVIKGKREEEEGADFLGRVVLGAMQWNTEPGL